MAIHEVTDTAPLSPEQATLAGLWAELLGVDEVGLDDDFFVLGGDSMLAIKAIVEAERRGVPVELADLFERPTIRRLTTQPNPETPAMPDDPASTGPVEPEDLVAAEDLMTLPPTVERAYPATLLQQGLIFEGMTQDESLYHDVISRRIPLPYDEAAMRRALEVLADRHEALRTSINLTDYSVVLQLVSRSASIPLRSTDARGRDTRVALRADRAHASEPFDPGRGPLVRVAATCLTDDSFQLTYGFHHVIMDGWSETVFINQLLRCYATLRLGGDPEPVGPRPSMVEFIRREREAVESPVRRQFWLSLAAELPAAAETRSRSGERQRVSIPVPATTRQRIAELGTTLGVPEKSILLAAHLAACQKHRGGSLPVTGLVTNGRLDEAGGDEMIGHFLNVLPFAVPVSRDSGDFIRRVLRAERDLFPHRRFPYAELKRLSGHHLYDVTFNYVHFHLERRLRSAGLMEQGSLEIHDKVSFPLIVDAVRDPDHGGLRLDFSADTAVWKPDELTRIADLHQVMLERVAARLPLDPSPEATGTAATSLLRDAGTGRPVTGRDGAARVSTTS
jgi:aryl carrier-like protein